MGNADTSHISLSTKTILHRQQNIPPVCVEAMLKGETCFCFRNPSNPPTATARRFDVFHLSLGQAFFLDGPKKTQGEKNSKLKEKTQNSSLKPKNVSLFKTF